MSKLSIVARVEIIEHANKLNLAAQTFLDAAKVMNDMDITSLPVIWSDNTEKSLRAVTKAATNLTLAVMDERTAMVTGKTSEYREQLKKSEYERKRVEKKKPKKKGTK